MVHGRLINAWFCVSKFNTQHSETIRGLFSCCSLGHHLDFQFCIKAGCSFFGSQSCKLKFVRFSFPQHLAPSASFNFGPDKMVISVTISTFVPASLYCIKKLPERNVFDVKINIILIWHIKNYLCGYNKKLSIKNKIYNRHRQKCLPWSSLGPFVRLSPC